MRTFHWLRYANWNNQVKDIRGTDLEGIPDSQIWEIARTEERLLITTDKGFTQYRNENHFGILVIRLKQPNSLKIFDRIMAAVDNIKDEEWPGLLVVMRDSIRSTWKKE